MTTSIHSVTATQVEEGSDGDVSCSDQPKKVTQGQIDDVTIFKRKKRNWKPCSYLHPWLVPMSILLYWATIHLQLIYNKSSILRLHIICLLISLNLFHSLCVILQDKSSQMVLRFYMLIQLEMLRLMELASIKMFLLYQTYQQNSSLY